MVEVTRATPHTRVHLPNWLMRDALPLVILLCGALAMIGPVLADPRTHVIGTPTDNIQYIYTAGWFAEALRSGMSPFIDTRINGADGLSLMATDVPYIGFIAVAPATWLGGPVFGYNALLFLAHMLSGYITYLWLLSLTGNRIGSLVAGLAFMLAPFRLTHSFGHPQLVSTYPLPLFFWALDRALRGTYSRRTIAGLVGATALLGAASQYYLVIGLVTGGMYALLTLILGRLNPVRGAWQAVPAVLVGALIGALPYLLLSRSGIFEPYDLAEQRMWSASPVNFLVPSQKHPVWGDLIAQLRPETLEGEKTLYLGLVAGLLALVGLFWRNGDQRAIWCGTALTAAVLAFGTDLHFGNLPLQQEHPFWLPAYYLAQLPFLNLVRVWCRFGIVTILFTALLAGMGAAWLTSWHSSPIRARLPVRAYWLIAVLLPLLVVIDFLPGHLTSFQLTPRPVDHWLAEHPGDFSIGHIPIIDDVTNYTVLYGTLWHGKRTFAFMHQKHIPAAFQDFGARSGGFPDSQSAIRLRTLGLRYLLLERSIFDGKRAFRWDVVLTRIKQTPELYEVADFGDTLVLGFR